MKILAALSLCILTLLIASCGSDSRYSDRYDSAPSGYPDASGTADAVPRVEKFNRANLRSYTVLGKRYHPLKDNKGFVQRGVASWYGKKFHGNKTANGERYDMYAMTAAHKHLPLPSYARVKNLENGRSIVVRVNDRGPFHGNRVIDLSYAAASKLGVLKKGTALVEVTAIDPRNPNARPVSKNEPRLSSKNPRVFIQVGSFANAHNAEKLRSKLSNDLKRNVSVESSSNSNGLYYRVLIGPTASIETANSVVDELEGLQVFDTQMIVR